MSAFWTILLVLVIAAVIFLLISLRFIGSLIQKVGPNEALIVYGRHTRVITNGGTVVWPMVEQATRFSLELMSFDVAPSQSLYTNQGIAVNVEAVTQLKVRSDRENIL